MIRRLSLAALAACAFLSGCAAGDRCVVKVGTYNIRLSGENGSADRNTPNAWKERRDDVVALIRKLDMDVFGLQEVCPDQAGFLRKNLPGYEFVGEHRNADRVTGEASPVCFRKNRFEQLDQGTFWLSESPDTPGRKGWGAACPRVCSYLVLKERKSGRKFCFANVHTDHVSALAREKGMLLVIERMKKFGAGAPMVFVGDHNCDETEAPARAVAAILENSVHVSETPARGAWRTFNGWKWRENEIQVPEAVKLPAKARKSLCGGSRIDYIYVSPGVRVLDCVTVDETRSGKRLYPSDHFPVTATVEFQ